MIPLKEEFLVLEILIGIILFIMGIIGIIIPYQPPHLITLGLTMVLAGSLFYNVELNRKKKEDRK